HHYPPWKNCKTPSSSSYRLKPLSSLSLWASNSNQQSGSNNGVNARTLKVREASFPSPLRRKLNLSLFGLTVILNGPWSVSSKTAISAEEELKLERYTDYEEGFTLLRPASYSKVDKAGATLLFEEMEKASNNVGVVVIPVRLKTLAEFGTPQFVADKLIQAEKRKESTKEAEVIGATERAGVGGLPVYEFEYKVNSTRGGIKRIFSAAFVSSKKLYLLNIVHSDNPESPLDGRSRVISAFIVFGGSQMGELVHHLNFQGKLYKNFWCYLIPKLGTTSSDLTLTNHTIHIT
ncbi:PsbP domain-containing protein 2, chloroplastic, partial [Linum perenne]